MNICTKCEKEERYRDLRICRQCNNEKIRNRLNASKNRRCMNCGNNFVNTNRFSFCSTQCNILNKIEKINDCWEWQGSFRGLYGTMSYQGKGQLSHRVSFKIFKGDIPKGSCVLHTCDNRRCVNPDHLFLGSHKENTHDMMKKGRMASFKGEGNSSAILTESQVLEIRDLHSKGMKIKKIAEKFKIKYYTCLDVVNRRNWRHI